MPPAGAPRSTGINAPPSSHAKLSDNDRADLEKLEAAVGRMQKHTRPDPYLVTISQDRHLQYQYQWRSQQWQWLHGAPFRPEEGEGIQYQTFMYQEPGRNMLSLHAQDYPEERPATADSTRNATGANTPAQGPKKVISLSAYKKKQTGETPTRNSSNGQDASKSAKQAALKGPAEQDKALKADSADMIKAVEEDARVDSTRESQNRKQEPRKNDLPPKQSELKRKREENTAPRETTTGRNDRNSPPPPKKTKRPRSPSPHVKSASQKGAGSEDHMPPKLSPLHNGPPSPDRFQLPPRISPDLPDTFQLPPRISPLLPSNIKASLEAMDERGAVGRASRNESNTKKGDATLDPKHKTDGRQRAPDPRKSPRARSKSPTKPHSQQLASDSIQDQSTRGANSTGTKQSLVAKIKFKKSRKEDVQRILKLPARPDKYVASPPSTPAMSDADESAEPASNERSASKTTDRSDPARRTGKGVAQKLGPVSKRTEERKPTSEKRPRAEADQEPANSSEPPAKKTKTDSAAELPHKKRQADDSVSQASGKKVASDTIVVKRKPSAAVQSDSSSQANQGKQKNVPAHRDLLNAKPDASVDSQTGKSPAQLQQASGKSNHTSQPNGTAPRKSANDTQPARKATAQEWTAERERLEKIGREIKHAASALLADKPNLAAKEAAAVNCLESLICYLVAFTCADRAASIAGRKAALPQWRSLQPFSAFVERNTSAFAPLSGLTAGLTMVFHAHMLDLTSQSPEDGPSRDSLIGINRSLIKAAASADEKLDADVLMDGFPKAWRGRAKTKRVEDEPTEPKRLLEGGYKLPMGFQTDPLQAARAGLAVLKEWVAKVGLEYDFQLGA